MSVRFRWLLLLCLAGVWSPLELRAQQEIEKDPDFLAGRAALDDGFYAVAAQRFESYMNKTISTRKKAYGAIFLFNAWYAQGEYEKITAWLREHWADIMKGTRYNPPAHYWYAQAMHAMGNNEEAIDILNDLDEKFPGDEFVPYGKRLRAEIMRDLGDLEAAELLLASYDGAHADRPDAAENLLDWADVLVRLKRPADAREKMIRIVQEHPEHPAVFRARLWLGQYDLERRDPAAATNWLGGLTADADAPPEVRADAWFALAAIATDQGDIARALVALQQGETFSTNADRQVEARIDQARLLMNTNRLAEAMEIMNKTALTQASMPQAGRLQLELADLLRAQREHALAESAYQRYLESFTDTAGLRHALYSRAWCLWELGRYAEAAVAFEKAHAALRNQLLQEQALVKSADAYFMNQQFKLAAASYERALQEFPESRSRPATLYQTGESYARAGDVTNAIRILRGLADDTNADREVVVAALLRLGRLHEQRFAWEQSAANYREIMDRFPDHARVAPALLSRALVGFRTGDYGAARRDFDSVLENYPATPEAEQAFFMRAWCDYQTGQTTNALAIARHFLVTYTNSPWSADVSFWLAEHEYNSGNYAAAETNFASVATAFPSNRLAPDALFWAGRASLEQKAYRRALDAYFSPIVRLYPTSAIIPEVRFAQGDALTEVGDFAGAILAFQEVVADYPAHPLATRALGRIGDCQFTLGAERPARFNEAIESYRALMTHPQASPDVAIQAEYKLARAYERIGRVAEAVTHYLNVMYAWLALQQEGIATDEVWFVRSAFSAAALKEAAGAFDEALHIYQRVVDTGLTAAVDANIRIDRIRNQRQKTETKVAEEKPAVR